MKTLVQQLQENPMFKFSMSSLELFHSNFLEWLFNQNPSAFLKCFDIDVETDKEYTIQRECTLGSDNVNDKKKKWITDIAVFAKEKGSDKNKELVLIIENKIKSLPSKGQLEAQAKLAGNCKKVLLTLFNLSKDKEFKDSHFKHITYSQLIEQIEKQTFENYNQYIDDYCKMVKTLQQIINEDNVVKENKEGYFTFHHYSENLETCGMQDAFRKYQAAQLVQSANNMFGEEYKNVLMKTGASLNHKRACVDIYLMLNDDLHAGVQIEHNQFRVIFEGKAIESLYKNTDKLSEESYKFLDKIWNEWLKGLSDGRKKDYCKYGKGFVYRYVIIEPEDKNPEIKIEELLESGNWLKEYPELSVKYILGKIIENKDDIIANL